MSAWDAGVTWRSEIVTAPTETAVDIAYVRDKVLRVANGTVEDEFIERAIKAATLACERDTGRALVTQTRKWIADRFPCGRIVLPAPPLIAVTSFVYVDADGEDVEWAASPAPYQIIPSGRVSKAALAPLYGETWPVARCQPDAVAVTYTCGYADADGESTIPDGLINGICLMVGEIYKQRSLSQIGTSIVNAPLDTKRFWPTVF